MLPALEIKGSEASGVPEVVAFETIPTAFGREADADGPDAAGAVGTADAAPNVELFGRTVFGSDLGIDATETGAT